MKLGMTLVLALVGASLTLTGCKPPPVNRASTPPLQSVAKVDIARYAGLWFEIARFENSFEEGCEGVTAQYTAKPDGGIKVLNTCRQGAPNGPAETAEGDARIVNAPANSQLKVSFFGPFEGNYWIIGLADDYSWALVGEPEGRYLWILARTPRISVQIREDLLSRLKAMGYNTGALKWVVHAPA